jgi:hypothetical protein
MSVGCATSIRGRKEEQQKRVVEANTTLAKQQTVATEQKEITQLYIGQNIIIKGLIG